MSIKNDSVKSSLFLEHKIPQSDPEAIAAKITREMFEEAGQKFAEYMDGKEIKIAIEEDDKDRSSGDEKRKGRKKPEV